MVFIASHRVLGQVMPLALRVNVPKAVQREFGVVPGITGFFILIVEVFIDVLTVYGNLLIFYLWKMIKICFRKTFKLKK